MARSLELLNQRRRTRATSPKSELGVQERLLDPLLDVLRALAVRLSPAGTGGRIARSLDRAGNPPAWSIERVMGAKGIGLVAGVVLALLLLGFDLHGAPGRSWRGRAAASSSPTSSSTTLA